MVGSKSGDLPPPKVVRGGSAVTPRDYRLQARDFRKLMTAAANLGLALGPSDGEGTAQSRNDQDRKETTAVTIPRR
jgi:hypothetical protein